MIRKVGWFIYIHAQCTTRYCRIDAIFQVQNLMKTKPGIGLSKIGHQHVDNLKLRFWICFGF
jgi:hypothetical protein